MQIVRLLLDFGFEVLVLAREEPQEFRDRHGFVYYAVDLSSLNEVHIAFVTLFVRGHVST